jgi:hypothetical protein
MNPEWAVVIMMGLQMLGLLIFSYTLSKWKLDIISAIDTLKEWSDGRFVNKDLCKIIHKKSVSMD